MAIGPPPRIRLSLHLVFALVRAIRAHLPESIRFGPFVTPTTPPKPRLAYLDMTKGILVVLMVVYHSLNYTNQYHLGFRLTVLSHINDKSSPATPDGAGGAERKR